MTPSSDVFSNAALDADLLSAPYPNPMDRYLRYAIRLREPSHVRARLMDAAGRGVAGILDEELPAGESVRSWAPSEQFRARLSRGVYFLRVETREGTRSRMVVITR